MAIGGYFINKYCWLLVVINGYQRILVNILFMDIGGYFIRGYWWILVVIDVICQWLLVVIDGYFIGGY